MLFVRWTDTTTAEDFDNLVAEIRAAREQAGRKVVYLATIPTTNQVPAADARTRITSAIEECAANCTSMHVVIEGQGMRRALVRSVMAGVLLIVMKRKHAFSVHTSIREALDAAAERAPFDVDSVMEQAQQQGALAPIESSESRETA